MVLQWRLPDLLRAGGIRMDIAGATVGARQLGIVHHSDYKQHDLLQGDNLPYGLGNLSHGYSHDMARVLMAGGLPAATAVGAAVISHQPTPLLTSGGAFVATRVPSQPQLPTASYYTNPAPANRSDPFANYVPESDNLLLEPFLGGGSFVVPELVPAPPMETTGVTPAAAVAEAAEFAVVPSGPSKRDLLKTLEEIAQEIAAQEVPDLPPEVGLVAETEDETAEVAAEDPDPTAGSEQGSSVKGSDADGNARGDTESESTGTTGPDACGKQTPSPSPAASDAELLANATAAAGGAPAADGAKRRTTVFEIPIVSSLRGLPSGPGVVEVKCVVSPSYDNGDALPDDDVALVHAAVLAVMAVIEADMKNEEQSPPPPLPTATVTAVEAEDGVATTGSAGEDAAPPSDVNADDAASGGTAALNIGKGDVTAASAGAGRRRDVSSIDGDNRRTAVRSASSLSSSAPPRPPRRTDSTSAASASASVPLGGSACTAVKALRRVETPVQLEVAAAAAADDDGRVAGAAAGTGGSLEEPMSMLASCAADLLPEKLSSSSQGCGGSKNASQDQNRQRTAAAAAEVARLNRLRRQGAGGGGVQLRNGDGGGDSTTAAALPPGGGNSKALKTRQQQRLPFFSPTGSGGDGGGDDGDSDSQTAWLACPDSWLQHLSTRPSAPMLRPEAPPYSGGGGAAAAGHTQRRRASAHDAICSGETLRVNSSPQIGMMATKEVSSASFPRPNQQQPPEVYGSPGPAWRQRQAAKNLPGRPSRSDLLERYAARQAPASGAEIALASGQLHVSNHVRKAWASERPDSGVAQKQMRQQAAAVTVATAVTAAGAARPRPASAHRPPGPRDLTTTGGPWATPADRGGGHNGYLEQRRVEKAHRAWLAELQSNPSGVVINGGGCTTAAAGQPASVTAPAAEQRRSAAGGGREYGNNPVQERVAAVERWLQSGSRDATTRDSGGRGPQQLSCGPYDSPAHGGPAAGLRSLWVGDRGGKRADYEAAHRSTEPTAATGGQRNIPRQQQQRGVATAAAAAAAAKGGVGPAVPWAPLRRMSSVS
ncbi:hypothetical protein VOLCADRAFT_95429 [Volvox carteri f. nagariensis]|uniref:Uncharacterized protein n=1 Tax=Volvox carteri f. nagariensis TaxID=3068 RepID=D8U7F4_VOLCA|nr:uncharacterized protein VOLCADRAFT_95429 [Volvox carteri f. nagariensis]EFJ44291.1 hypothetical protein VOLCADRAFT_95429 [Volvox carteri f. nagariensis]|eukprot:XP_002954650.1 hypothetical protein VOLCADRAFT_95429 [Volvox carteri f. nagariensis]